MTLRAVMWRKYRDAVSGLETQHLVTLDFDCPELEKLLTRGGSGENAYDITELVGVETLPKEVIA